MTERMRITADGMTISRDKDGNVQWIQVEGVTLVRKQRAEKAEQTIKEISELPEKWEGSYMTRGANNVEQCATVLRAALNPPPPRS